MDREQILMEIGRPLELGDIYHLREQGHLDELFTLAEDVVEEKNTTSHGIWDRRRTPCDWSGFRNGLVTDILVPPAVDIMIRRLYDIETYGGEIPNLKEHYRGRQLSALRQELINLVLFGTTAYDTEYEGKLHPLVESDLTSYVVMAHQKLWHIHPSEIDATVTPHRIKMYCFDHDITYFAHRIERYFREFSPEKFRDEQIDYKGGCGWTCL